MKKIITVFAIAALMTTPVQAVSLSGWFNKNKPVPVRNLHQYNLSHPNGNPKISYSAYTSQNGKEVRHGAYRKYNLNGSIKESGIYADGVITKKTTYKWYGSGQKSREANVTLNAKNKEVGRATTHTWYLNGKPSGDWIYQDGVLVQNNTYYQTGIPKEQKRYNNEGLLNGAQQGWYASGKKSYIYNYQDGKKQGSFIQWNENGAVIRNELWEQDTLIKLNGKDVCPSQAKINFTAVKKTPKETKHRR